MAVRLNKALKELNVGINTVAEYLQKEGIPLEDASPNAKITDEQFGMLMKKFGYNSKKNYATPDEITYSNECELKEMNDHQAEAKENKETPKQQFKIVGNINDLQKNQSSEDYLEQDEDGVYRLTSPQETGVQFKHVGFIDLNSLNSKTRPERKSKKERKKECIEKKRQMQGGMLGAQNEKDGNADDAGAQGNGKEKKSNRIKNERIDISEEAKNVLSKSANDERLYDADELYELDSDGVYRNKKSSKIGTKVVADYADYTKYFLDIISQDSSLRGKITSFPTSYPAFGNACHKKVGEDILICKSCETVLNVYYGEKNLIKLCLKYAGYKIGQSINSRIRINIDDLENGSVNEFTFVLIEPQDEVESSLAKRLKVHNYDEDGDYVYINISSKTSIDNLIAFMIIDISKLILEKSNFQADFFCLEDGAIKKIVTTNEEIKSDDHVLPAEDTSYSTIEGSEAEFIGNQILLNDNVNLNYRYKPATSHGFVNLQLHFTNCTINSKINVGLAYNTLILGKEGAKDYRESFIVFSCKEDFTDEYNTFKSFILEFTPDDVHYDLDIKLYSAYNFNDLGMQLYIYKSNSEKLLFEELTDDNGNNIVRIIANNDLSGANNQNKVLSVISEKKVDDNMEVNNEIMIAGDKSEIIDNNGVVVSDTPQKLLLKSLRFRNFRKFKGEFDKLDLGAINVFVGKNNSGKSTTVKGLQFILNFLKNGTWSNTMFPVFDFGGNLNVGSYGRALNVEAEENEIMFEIDINDFNIQIFVTGQSHSPYGDVTKIIVAYKKDEYIFTFDFTAGFSLVINDKPAVEEEDLKDLIKDKEKIELQIKDAKISKAIILKDRLKNIEALIESYSPKHYEFAGIAPRRTSELKTRSLLDSLMKAFITPEVLTQLKVADRKIMEGKLSSIIQLAEDVSDTINSINVERVYAHSASQTSVYNINDRNDFVAQCIHDFHAAYIDKENGGDEYYQFIKKWMDSEHFEIGDDYILESLENEAYTLKITDKGSNKGINLGDKGKGTIQLMTLLMRLVTIAKRNRNANGNVIVLIEEPEQNLHPYLQSFLADFFEELHNKFGMLFIVETHSEYIVRHIQVMVASKKYCDEHDFSIHNPFEVIYFPSEKTLSPYDMKIQKDGKFQEDFMPGFFNVSVDSSMELFDLENMDFEED